MEGNQQAGTDAASALDKLAKLGERFAGTSSAGWAVGVAAVGHALAMAIAAEEAAAAEMRRARVTSGRIMDDDELEPTAPDILTPEQVGRIKARTSKRLAILRAMEDKGPDEVLTLALCATVQAQAEVIQRYKDGWKPVYEAWVHKLHNPEPVEESHQIVLYGEVVTPRGGEQGDGR